MKAAQNLEHPQGLLPSLRQIEFVCPNCRGCLVVSTSGYDCEKCQKKYPVHAGIPDFRVFPDPYLDFQEDYDRTEIVLAGLEKHRLEKLLEYYWSFSDITPENLRSKFIRSVMLGEKRAKRTLETFKDGTFNTSIAARKVLEIGSGTGSFLAAAAGRYEQIIGIDIAMRWLHVSRRRFMDKGLPVPPLVCCCAEYLPFEDNSFDLVAAASTLEFVKDQEKVLSEAARVLGDDGAFYLNTVNRYSLARDPYSYLWGVGFLPRKWHAKYVFWRNNAVYKTRTLSFNELDRLASVNFSSREFVLPDIDPLTLRQFSLFTRFQIHVYRFLKKLSVISYLFKQIGPGWDVVLRKST
ncbi:MAG: methyltransferase domain-containing protein [Pyrinomonadaceae bacterium]